MSGSYEPPETLYIRLNDADETPTDKEYSVPHLPVSAVPAPARRHMCAGEVGLSGVLGVALWKLIDAEMEITLQVGTMIAGGTPRGQIAGLLGITGVEYKMALQRLEAVAWQWRQEDEA